MTREIKFRAWHKELRKIYDWHFLSNNEYMEDVFKNVDLDLMQFTGLKDKNGVEIYEGDIVLIEDEIVADSIGGFNRYEPLNHISEVRFSNASFGVEIRETAQGVGRGFYTFTRLESELDISSMGVIGNIYQNSDLLK